MMIESEKYLNESLIKLKLCWEGLELEINPKKSEIMRILRREDKVKEINNILGIPEVNEYKYLVILINQNLKFKGVEYSLKKSKFFMQKDQLFCQPQTKTQDKNDNL